MGADPVRLPERVQADAVREQVDKIVASAVFVGSKKLSQLLVFLVDQALEGRSFNEYSIALDVFQRDESFDPRLDPVVRVHMLRLRNKLNQYRAIAGLRDPIEILLPPRTYVPTIRMRLHPVPPKSIGPIEPASVQQNIAVRSFRSLSSEAADEYFCDGLAEELIHALAKVKHLRVVPVQVVAGGDVNLTARELHEQFHVEAVLEGNVRKGPHTLRVAAHLTDTADGSVVWSEIYHCLIDDLLAVQEKIATAIVRALFPKMDPIACEPTQIGSPKLDESTRIPGDLFLL